MKYNTNLLLLLLFLTASHLIMISYVRADDSTPVQPASPMNSTNVNLDLAHPAYELLNKPDVISTDKYSITLSHTWFSSLQAMDFSSIGIKFAAQRGAGGVVIQSLGSKSPLRDLALVPDDVLISANNASFVYPSDALTQLESCLQSGTCIVYFNRDGRLLTLKYTVNVASQ